MVFADNLGAVEKLRRTYDFLSPILYNGDQSETASSHIELIFHTVVGELERAGTVGRQLIDIARKQDSPPTLARALRFASLPLRRLNRIAEACGLLTEALEIAEKYRLTSAVISACDCLGTVLLEQSDLSGAEALYHRGCLWLGHSQDMRTVSSIACLGARIALEQGCLQLAEERMARIGQAIRGDPVLKRTSDEFAVRLRIALAKESRLEDEGLISDFEHAFLHTRGMGGQDYAAFTYYLLLVRRDGQERALRSLTEYAHRFRRERSTLPPVIDRIVLTRESLDLAISSYRDDSVEREKRLRSDPASSASVNS
jgi:hypothetical protein